MWYQFQEILVLKVFELIQGEGIYLRSKNSYIVPAPKGKGRDVGKV